MKFLAQVHVETESIHPKFQVARTHSLVNMTKKPNFGSFKAYFGYFQLENPTQNVSLGLKFCIQLPLTLGYLHAKFGANSQRRLAVAQLNTPRCPKTQNFGPFFFYFKPFFCIFQFLYHYKTLQSSKYTYGEVIPEPCIYRQAIFMKFTFFENQDYILKSNFSYFWP